MEDNSDGYYHSLLVLDRLEQARTQKGITLTKVSNLLGNNPCYYPNKVAKVSIGSPEFIRKVCEILDVSLEWVLTGKNYGKYKPVVINYDKLIEYHESQRYKEKVPNRISVFISNLKNKKSKNLVIKTLLSISDYYHLKSIYPYIVKEL